MSGPGSSQYFGLPDVAAKRLCGDLTVQMITTRARRHSFSRRQNKRRGNRSAPRRAAPVLLAALAWMSLAGPAGAARVGWKVDGGNAQLVLAFEGQVTYTVRNWRNLILIRFSRPVTGNIQPFARASGALLKEVKLLGRGRVLLLRPVRPKVFKLQHGRKGQALVMTMADSVAARQAAKGTGVQPGTADPNLPVPVPVTIVDLPGDKSFRLVFRWSVPFTYRIALQRRRATLVFARPGRLVLPPALLRALRERKVVLTQRSLGKSFLVILDFPAEMSVRPSRAGASLRLDIRAGSAPAAAAPPGGGDGTIAPTLTVDRRANGGTRMTFDWPVSVSAAAFRYGGHLWIVFGAPARFDLAVARRRMGADVEDISQTLMDNATIVRLRTRGAVTASLEREGWEWRVTLQRGAVKPRTPVFIGVAPKKGRGGTIELRAGAAGSVISITDPAVGSTLFILPVRAPGLGIERERRYPTFRLLPTAQGIVVEPMADGLTIAVRGDTVAITNPLGLHVSGDR